jgi:hypothetical protein
LQGKASLASGRVALRVGECCYSDDAFGRAFSPALESAFLRRSRLPMNFHIRTSSPFSTIL